MIYFNDTLFKNEKQSAEQKNSLFYIYSINPFLLYYKIKNKISLEYFLF